jgi:hypothetical protein
MAKSGSCNRLEWNSQATIRGKSVLAIRDPSRLAALAASAANKISFLEIERDVVTRHDTVSANCGTMTLSR